MKVFKKTALLITVIVLAVVLSIGAVAGAAMLSEGEETLGEVYNAVQVTTDGKVNLKVYYSELGDAETFVAQVIDPSTGKVDKTYTYAKSELEETKTENGYCVKVPLRASQMTYTVSVKAVAGDVESTAMEFTVADYAQQVLADADNAKYHDAMRALLNWGAMAQTFFGDATSDLANVNVFARSTNPVSVVNGTTVPVPERGAIDTAFKSANVELSEGTIAMNFLVDLAGSDIEGEYTREGLDAPVALDVTHVSGTMYRVSIRNISVQNFDKVYTLTVDDGNGPYNAEYSVLEYINYLATAGSKDANGNEFTTDQRNVAKAMYQFYQAATGKTGAATCAHGNVSQVYWVPAADGEYVKCSYCLKTMGHQAIDSGVNAYASANTLQYAGATGYVDATWMEEDGVQFVRFDNFYGNRDNWGDISIGATFAGKTGVTGQYMVIKYRVSAEGNSKTAFETFANTNKGGENNLTGKGQADIVMSKDGEWHTVVINLAERVKDPSVAFVDEGDGTYNLRYLSLRLFGGATAVSSLDDSAEGRYTYTYSYKYMDGETEKTGYKTVYGEPLSDEEIAENGYTLAKLGKQSVTAEAYVDLAYVALCDSEAEVKSLIDTAEYESSVSNTKSLYLNTADDSCARHIWDGVEAVENGTYSYNCGQCGEALYTKTVPESVSAFISPYTLSAPVAKAENNKFTPNTQYQMTEKAFSFDGVPYFGFNGTTEANKTAQFIWMRAANKVASASAHERWTLDIDQAKYLVIKARGNAGALTDVTFNFGTSGAASYKSVKLPLSAAGADKWGVYVVDLSKVLSAYYAKNTETDTYELDTFYFNITTFETTDRVELSYIAFVEDWAGVDAIVEEDTFYNLTDTAGAYAELNTAAHTCVGEHPGYATQVVNGTYKYACTACEAVSYDYGIKADAVNALWATDTLYTKVTQSNAASGWATITGTYTTKQMVNEDGEFYLHIEDVKSNGQWHGWFPISGDGNNAVNDAGRYMVMKVRNNSSSVAWSSIGFWVTSSQRVTASWAAGSFTVSTPQDDQWHVIVVDLAARSSEYIANEDGTYDLMTMHLRPMGGNGTSMDSSTDESMDIAYMAFFDDLADIKDIVKEDTFEMSKTSSSNVVLQTATGTCAYCTPVYVADETDERGYHYECSVCGKLLAMDYYESGKGGCFAYNAGQYAGTATLKTDEAGFNYMSFLSTGTSGTFFNYNANNTGGGGVSANAVRAGRYLVMKLKGDTAASVTFHIGTDNFDKKNSNYVGGSVGALTVDTMPKDWTVVVVDLYGLTNYSMGESHKIFMSSTTGGGSTVANGAQVDLAYVMLVNDFADIAGLTAGENVQYYGNTLNNTPITPDEMCDGVSNHTYELATATDNGVTTNTATCIVCGATKVQTVSADINWFAPLSGMGKYQHTLTTGLLDTAEGVMFNRYTRGGATGGNHLNLTGGSGAGSATSGTFTTGKYIAIKYRVYVEDGTGTFGFNVGTGAASGNSLGTLDATSIKQGEWRVAFIDASGAAKWTSDGSAQSIYMMITIGGTGDYTFDVAWAAVVDSVDEMKTLLRDGETYYDLGSDWSKAGTHFNKDGTCVTHNATESVSGSTYTYACSVCGTVAKTITVDESVTKYMSANVLNTTAKVYYGGSHAYAYDADNNVAYMNTGAIQTIWQRMDRDLATNQTAGNAEQFTENVGNAKYLVVKARSSDASAYLRFAISTAAKNSDIKTVTESDFTDGVLNSTIAGYKKILENGQTDSDTKCTAVGDQYYSGSGIKSVYLMATGAATGEWVTYVIDLEAVCDGYYEKVEGQDYYDVDTFYFHNAGTNDIAYVAFVEGDWAEIDALVEETVVTQITAGGSSTAVVSQQVNVADGSVVTE